MKYLSIISVFFCNVSNFQCKRHVDANDISIFYYSPLRDNIIEKLQKRCGDDYFIIMDDEQFYYNEAIQFLEKENIVFKRISSEVITIRQKAMKILISKEIEFGGFIFVVGKDIHFIHSIDVIEFVKKMGPTSPPRSP